MLYESGVQDVSYDINMSKFTIIDFNPELSIYRTLSADSIDDLKSVSSVQVDSILSDGKRQIFYEEALSDKCTYYFKIENGGLANIQFQSSDPSSTYEITVYYHAKHYDEKVSDSIIVKYLVNESSHNLPVILPAGYKYITITRITASETRSLKKTCSAYGIVLNQLKWEDISEKTHDRTYTQGDALPCVGTPPSYTVSNLFYNKTSFTCPSCNNNHSIKADTNCYNYALNLAYNYAVGYYSNIYMSALNDLCGIGHDLGTMCTSLPVIQSEDDIRWYLENDASCEQYTYGGFPANEDNTTGYLQAVNATSISPCPSYRYKIAYCYTPNGTEIAYHFYRQNPIGSGETYAKWSHKQGNGTSVSTEDADGDDIYNPYWCDRGIYVSFGRYYVVRNPAISE